MYKKYLDILNKDGNKHRIYKEELMYYFEYLFPNRRTFAICEIESEILPIDIHYMVSEESEYMVVYTTNMSSLPMKVPDEFADKKEMLNKAELMMILPKEWPMADKDFLDINNYWPIWLLKDLAISAHKTGGWIGSLYVKDYIEHFSNNTSLRGVMTGCFEDISVLETSSGEIINIYCVIPLYREEMNYIYLKGQDSFLEKFAEFELVDYMIDPKRKKFI